MNNTDFKDLLKNEIEKELKGHQRYFSREDLRNLVPGVHLGTFNKYLVDFGKEGILYGAGRGWHSFIKQSFELDQLTTICTLWSCEVRPALSSGSTSTPSLRSVAQYKPRSSEGGKVS